MAALSQNALRLPGSGIRKIFDLASALEKTGTKLFRFDVGRPDLATPAFVVEAAKQALDAGFTKYVGNRGIPELLEALSHKLRTHNGTHYDPESEIVVTTGASEAVAAAMFAILEPGSEVLVPEPNWPHYGCCAQLAGATAVPVPLSVDDGFALDHEILERHVTPRTRMVVFSNPTNPTGKVYDERTRAMVLDFARRRDLFVLADEMYEHFAYGPSFRSFLSLPGAKERTVYVNGMSKCFGMTGWRLGYVAAPAEVSTQINKVHQYLTVCGTSFVQKAAVQALVHPHATEFLTRMRSDFRQRNDVLLEEATRLADWTYHPPEGAFYFFPRLPSHFPDGEETAQMLLERAHMTVVPGSAFGAAFRRFIRISYGASSLADLREGMRRLSQFFRSWRAAS